MYAMLARQSAEGLQKVKVSNVPIAIKELMAWEMIIP
jgi:hypothetical protein